MLLPFIALSLVLFCGEKCVTMEATRKDLSCPPNTILMTFFPSFSVLLLFSLPEQ